jgi:hypothetical protein
MRRIIIVVYVRDETLAEWFDREGRKMYTIRYTT